jgi:hypothetical protein
MEEISNVRDVVTLILSSLSLVSVFFGYALAVKKMRWELDTVKKSKERVWERVEENRKDINDIYRKLEITPVSIEKRLDKIELSLEQTKISFAEISGEIKAMIKFIKIKEKIDE